MKSEEFEKLVEEGIALLPEQVLAKLDNVAIVIEPRPTKSQRKGVRAGSNTVLFGLYEGIPLTERGAGYAGALPDKITIFREAIEAWARSPEEIRQIVRDTVWHELAHHFGSDEAGAETAVRHWRRKSGK